MKTAAFIVLILTIPLIACESEADKKRFETMLIEQEVEKRLADYKEAFDINCREKVLEDATRIADSLIIEEARLLKDTLLKPFKPERPEKPEILPFEDTLKVQPFLPKNKRDSTRQ